MNQLSIVIPIYNEKENIKYLFNEFKQYKIYEKTVMSLWGSARRNTTS